MQIMRVMKDLDAKSLSTLRGEADVPRWNNRH